MTEDVVTRERIILVAAELFADQGYQRVSARTVCAKAGANHAAINYYFRNKLNLYREVLFFAYQKLMEAQPLPAFSGDFAKAPDELREWLRWYLDRLLGSTETIFAWRLVSRELQEPSEAFDALSDKFMTPVFASLERIVASLCQVKPKKTNEASTDVEVARLVRLTTLSIISQCLIYLMGRPMVERLLPGVYTEEFKRALVVEQLTAFSLAGAQAVRSTMVAKIPALA